MDKFFKAIGRFFKAIGNWIKNTAWVQPVLIVTIVFAVMFSFSSNSPLMKWIKSLSNSDTTGQFFDKHKVTYDSLYSDIYVDGEFNCENGKKPDGKKCGSKLDLSDYDGVSYVVFITSNSNENDFKNFYNSLSKEGAKHFYVVDFSKDDNKKSFYNSVKGKWEDDSAAVYYSHLLGKLYSLYESDEFENYSEKFYNKYSYYSKIADWELTSSDKENAYSDLTLPMICKYEGNVLKDFRFCSSISTNYSSNVSLIQLLSEFKTGVAE